MNQQSFAVDSMEGDGVAELLVAIEGTCRDKQALPFMGELVPRSWLQVSDALQKHQDVFLTVFTESLMTYALGRRIGYTDMPSIRTIVRDAGKGNLKMSAFVMGVVNSPAFKMGVADTGKERRATDVAR